MSEPTHGFRSRGLAAMIAVILGATMIAAVPAPAMAQSPSFNFSIQIPGGSVEFGTKERRSRERDRDRDFRWNDRDNRYCLSDRRITRELRQEGWRNIEFGRELRRNRVEITAQYSRDYYLLQADRCRGDIQVIERLKRVKPGIGLQFKFGG